MEEIHCVQAGCGFVTTSLDKLLEHQEKTGHNK